MTPVDLFAQTRRILVLGAHADDIELGCGGTILTLLDGRDDVHVDWRVLTSDATRDREAREGAARFLDGAASCTVDVAGFRDGYLPWDGPAVKDWFHGLARSIDPPDLVLTPSLHDRHQDHRAVAELTWNTFRRQLVLEYEIVKYEGDLRTPNVYVPLSRETLDLKLSIMEECFTSQQGKPWWSREAFESLVRIRGIESLAPSGFAEGFHGRKLVAGPPR